MENKNNETTYYVDGMHCASCELLIEKNITDLHGVEFADASTAKGRVLIRHRDFKPNLQKLNSKFKTEGYKFSETPFPSQSKQGFIEKNATVLGIIILVIIAFYFLQKNPILSLVNITEASSLPTFFIFGLLAGVSSCAALVGGFVLSMTKNWTETYAKDASYTQKITPQLLFNIGRLLSFVILGALLGLIGNKIGLSANFSSMLVVVISVVMFLLGLQMLGVKSLRKFQLTLPKSITKNIINESKVNGKFMPLLMGALTFFFPCGFTITVQGLALISGDALQGALIALAFAAGTAPMLLVIGFSSVKLLDNHKLSKTFLKVAGVLVIFFAVFNINAQLNVLGYKSLSDISFGAGAADQIDSIADDQGEMQVIKMEASLYGYQPDYFQVKVDQPVQWRITNTGASGCTNAIISRTLFDGEIDLPKGKTVVVEFTPEKLGVHKFSCWMGMVSGTIEVVE